MPVVRVPPGHWSLLADAHRDAIKAFRELYMTKITQVPSRSQELLTVGRISGKHTALILGLQHVVHFWDGKPAAVQTGGCIWHHAPLEGAVTKMLNEIEPKDAPRIRASADQFDFMLGQVLTSAGLPLTKADK